MFDTTRIFDANLTHNQEFTQLALDTFNYQAKNNLVYKEYIQQIGIQASKVDALEKIPFLPVTFFKNKSVQSSNFHPEIIFSSSSTSGQGQSFHNIKSVQDYIQITEKSFAHFWGENTKFCHLALLPSYLEREGSSLVYMLDHFIAKSPYKNSGFYLHDFNALATTLRHNKDKKIPTILWSVTFALLDFAEQQQIDFPELIIIETGGMKGRRKEITRGELYVILQKRLKVKTIASEYGMTEMMSQCYTRNLGKFECPPFVKVFGRELNDPFSFVRSGRNKALNIIDLANFNSCAFLALSDIGNIYEDGSFEVLGRLDYSDIRGCNLMIV